MISVILFVIVQIYGTSGGFIFLPQHSTSLPEVIINRDEFRGLQPPSFLRMTLMELKCIQGGFFRAKIRLKSPLPALPTIENSFPPNNCLRFLGDHLKIDISGEIFQDCGVSPCGEDLCLRLRFPHVDGLRTASDGLLTLKCRSQERFMSQNHILRVSVDENLARSAPSVIEGGSQTTLRSHLGLFRRSRRDGSFTEALAEGGEVLLGEDLMLKAQMRAEDGWNFTGMSDISLARLSQAGDVLNSAILVTQEGCVNPSMRSICPENPSFDPPLGHKFRFKAISFPGMIPGEEIVLNVRLFGCLNLQDCLPNLTNCRSRSRIKRSSASQSQVSRISFRIALGGKSTDSLTPIFSISGLAIFCFGCLIVLSVLYRKKFQQIH